MFVAGAIMSYNTDAKVREILQDVPQDTPLSAIGRDRCNREL